jgi:hypothetical protein
MKLKFHLLAAAAALLIATTLAACQGRDTVTPTAAATEAAPTLSPTTIAAVVSETPTPESPTPTQQPQPERIHYSITADLDYEYQTVSVEELITIPHPGGGPLSELALVVPPNAWPGVFWLEEISWASGENIQGYALEGVRLSIPLVEPWQPGAARQLNIRYQLQLPVQNAREGYGPSPFGYTALQTNLVDWYPMVPPYQEGIGWVIHDPYLFGEYLVYPLADFQVDLSYHTPTLVVAASSLPVQEGNLLHYNLERGRNFVFSISPDYQVLEGETLGIKVFGYIFPAYQYPGQAAFQATIEALELYSKLYGPYGQDSFSMVQADFNHGMEYQGLYFQSRGFFDTYTGSQDSYLISIAVHETAHQWWYAQVANDQALEPWLDEALCTFSELVYYDALYPAMVDWWWATRVNYYQPEGVIDRSIYGFREYTDQYLNYRNATYLQGAKFLARLRDSLGDEIFFAFLREYASRYQGEIVTGDDFFSLLGEFVDLDQLDWLGEYFGERE